jgi:hypothetical protein
MSGEESNTHSPLFSFIDYAFQLLDLALDYGISEFDFWDMTLEENIRAITSRQRVAKKEAEEKAMYDYVLADMIGRSIARVYSKDAKLPEIYEAYPTLFDEEEIEEARHQKKMEEAAKRFTELAASFNEKFKRKEQTISE